MYVDSLFQNRSLGTHCTITPTSLVARSDKSYDLNMFKLGKKTKTKKNIEHWHFLHFRVELVSCVVALTSVTLSCSYWFNFLLKRYKP